MAAPKGNRNAAKAAKWRDALNRALAQFESEAVQKGQALNQIAMNLVESALKGDKDAWQEIANRLDGKPAQALIHQGDEDQPMITKVIREIVRIDHKDA